MRENNEQYIEELLEDLKQGVLPKRIHDVIIAIGAEMLKCKIREHNYFMEHMSSNVLFDGEVPKHKKNIVPVFNDSERKIKRDRKKRCINHSVHQERYSPLNDNQMRFRYKNGKLQPAILSNNVASEFYHSNYRHIKLFTDSSNKKLYMTFGLDNPDTVAPARNPEISRLTSFGRNKSTNEITTFAFNGELFQKTILNYAGIDTENLKDGDVILVDFKRKRSENGRKVIEILKK